MKKSIKKTRVRCIAVCICAVMMLVVVGCGKSSSGDTASTATPSSSPQATDAASNESVSPTKASSSESVNPTEAAAANDAVNPFKKYDPAITLTFAKIDSSNYADGEDAQNNMMYDLWKDLMGVNVVNKISCQGSAYKDKMQLAIVSNDIPDFAVVDTTVLSTLIKNDMVEDITDIYNTWASDKLKAIVGQNNDALFAPATRDGRYMALPLPTMLADNVPIMWIRSDWLDKLGLSAPTTMEEAFDIAMAFTTQDPDGNGKNDTYGLYMDKDLRGLDYLMAAYNVYMGINIKQDDGSYKDGCIDPRAKAPLGKLQELYKAGGIDREFAVKEASKAEEAMSAGKIGIYLGLFWHPLGVMKDSVANVDADWIPVAMPPAVGVDKYVVGSPLNVMGYMYAKKGMANPEALIVMMNYLADGYCSPWVDGKHYDYETEFNARYTDIAAQEKNRNVTLNNVMPFQFAVTTNWGPIFRAALENGDEHLEGFDADYQRVRDTTMSKAEQWSWKKIYLEAYDTLNFENIRYSDYNGAPTDTMIKNGSLLDKEKLTTYIAIIMGDKSVDDFDAFVETYQSIGGAKISDEIVEALKD